jgi:hypothetical protein
MTTKLSPPRHAANRAVGATRVEGSAAPDDRSRLQRIWRSPADQPRWARPALLGLLALTAVLYLWDLSASGYANSFYAAAVQAGTKSWKAFFFGSLDAGNSITVDKPPASLWVMDLSGRIFGFNSWSLLVPQALEGVAAVGLLYGAVRRVAGSAAGLAAGAALALTPAAVLLFRFDNPDALLTLCLVTAAYAVTRALEAGRTRWLVVAGSVIGLAFLTKMLQGFLVLPAFALVYLFAGPVSLGRRIRQVLAGTVAVVVAAGWWVLAVELWPASARPYIGGSTNNSVLDLVFGYNGLGRLLGGSGNAGGGSGGASGSSFGGATGLSRLFSSEMGNEISWLLPAALLGLVALLWFTRRAPRTDRLRGRPAVGRLADGHRPGVQLHEGDHPPLLHGGSGPGGRRSRGSRRARRMGTTRHGHWPPGGRCAHLRRWAVELCPARADQQLAARTTLDRPRPHGGDRNRRGRADPAAAGPAQPARERHSGRVARDSRVRRGHRSQPAQRQHPERGPRGRRLG